MSDLLRDRTIWINFHATLPEYGQAVISGQELCVSVSACRMGRWTVLATLIHELAHINGAPGRPSKLAEEALLHTGLGRKQEHSTGIDDPNTPYEPGIVG